MQNQTSSNSPNAAQLRKLRVKAIRAGVWFNALPRIDRVLIDLTIKVTENIRSSSLAKSIMEIVGKLEDLTQNCALQSLKSFGKSLAAQISEVAQRIGHPNAEAWAVDQSFALFLAVTHTNR